MVQIKYSTFHAKCTHTYITYLKGIHFLVITHSFVANFDEILHKKRNARYPLSIVYNKSRACSLFADFGLFGWIRLSLGSQNTTKMLAHWVHLRDSCYLEIMFSKFSGLTAYLPTSTQPLIKYYDKSNVHSTNRYSDTLIVRIITMSNPGFSSVMLIQIG